MTKTKNRRAVTSIGVVAIAALMIASVAAYDFAEAVKPGSGGGDSTKGADKTMIAGNTMTYVLDTYKWTPIVYGEIKTSSTGDLIVTFNEECAIHTGLKLTNEVQDLTSAVRQDVRLVIGGELGEDGKPIVNANGDIIDGKVIPAVYGDIGYDDPDYYGVVTMCGRAYHIDTNLLSTVAELCGLHNPFGNGTACTLPENTPGEVKEIFFNSFIRTKQAHSWDWVVLDKGAGVHLVTIQAKVVDRLAGMTYGTSEAKDVASDMESCMKDHEDDLTRNCTDSFLEVGKRSIIVQVDKLPVGTTYG